MDWPKHLFGLFRTMLQKNPDEHFGQPDTLYIYFEQLKTTLPDHLQIIISYYHIFVVLLHELFNSLTFIEYLLRAFTDNKKEYSTDVLKKHGFFSLEYV